MTSTLVLSASTSVSTLYKFPARKPFKCSIQNSRRIVLKEIPILASSTHYSNAYNLFQSSSFHDNTCKFQVEPFFIGFSDTIRTQDSSVTLPDYFRYCRYWCVHNFCKTQLKYCSFCSNKCNNRLCFSNCSDCTTSDHSFYYCPKLLRWLHDPDTSHHILWKDSIIRDWIVSNPPPHL